MKIKVTKISNKQDFEKVNPSIVYNRYDLFCSEGEFEAVKIKSNAGEKIVEYRLGKNEIELGLWLTPVSVEELESLLGFIKKNHPNVKKVIYKNGVIPYGKSKTHNNYRIIFPESAEEMKARISSDSWHKMRRRNRRAAEKYGEMSLVEYNDGNIPEEIVEKFFEFKLATRNRTYNMTAKEYLERYHVSDCYVVMFGDTVGGMHFCCEQCPMVYGENHSYNPEMREYSLGKFIFTHSLIRIVEKKHTEIFLGGGDYEYKTHYGSIEETLYDCEINMDTFAPKQSNGKQGTMKSVKQFAKKHLPAGVVKKLKQMKNK